MKETTMKSLKTLRNSLFLGCIALGTAGLLTPSQTLAEGKGASKLMFIASEQAAPSKLSQMSCPRCTDGYTKVANTSAKGLRAEPMRTVAVHMCSSCETKIVSVGAGKAKTDKVTHSCGNNGAVEASCCMAAR
jgi:hypothetical protein